MTVSINYMIIINERQVLFAVRIVVDVRVAARIGPRMLNMSVPTCLPSSCAAYMIFISF